MTVFVAHAVADEDAADQLARVIERRGDFVEHEQADRIGRPLGHMDCVVLIWSNAMQFDPGRLVLERRALDAWADGKLVVAILDHTPLPVGLRDLPVVDATFEQRRTFAWEEAAAIVRQQLMRQRRSGDYDVAEGAPGEHPAIAASPAASSTRGRAAGVAASSVFTLIILALLIGGVWRILSGAAFDLPDGARLPPWTLLAAAAALALVAIGARQMTRKPQRARVAARTPRRGGSSRPPAARRMAPSAPLAPADGEAGLDASAQASSSALFVSYAHLDSPSVDPLVAAVKHEGREVWTDKAGIPAGEGWAGEIVRAIRGAHGVLVMCSARAFDSDHVKREVYLADRYKKPMLPVFLEAADLPEDFEYFFAGVQWLELHKTPEADRAAAIARAVAAV
jgi:hypothetical protein